MFENVIVFNKYIKSFWASGRIYLDCIGFRTPHYGQLHTQSVYDILDELNYKYSSSTTAYGTDGFGAPYIHKYNITEIPTGCSKHFPFAIFDSWSMLRMKKPLLGDDKLFIKEFEETMPIIKDYNLFLTHYFDPYDIIENGKIEALLDSLKFNSIDTKLYKDLFWKTKSLLLQRLDKHMMAV